MGRSPLNFFEILLYRVLETVFHKIIYEEIYVHLFYATKNVFRFHDVFFLS